MKSLQFGIILKVCDLDICRMFYRDILGFGEPVLDSSFLVHFKLAPCLTLTLEKNGAPFLEHASAATGWFFECPDVAVLSEKLENSGFAPLEPFNQFGASGIYRGRDPENNVFYVKARMPEA